MSALVGDTLTHTAESDAEIKGLTADSRSVMPGYLFAALPGSRQDGHDFIAHAIEKGASALLVQSAVDLDKHVPELSEPSIPVIRDPNPRRRLSLFAAKFYQIQPSVVAAVTGTNGKTSVVNFTFQIWSHIGLRAAAMGTLGVLAPGQHKPSSLTTPEPVKIHQTLKELAEDGVGHLALEASSHGLDQYRLDGIELTAAAFTNLTQDHLDYHEDLSQYFQSKLRLFQELLPPTGTAVVNVDDENAPTIMNVLASRGQRAIQVGMNASTDGENIKLLSQRPTAEGQHIQVAFAGRNLDINLPLLGNFQASNAVVAAGLVIACGADPATVFEALTSLNGVPGRLQRIGLSREGAPVYVDYAHTPGALETVLSAVRQHTTGYLHVVFGAGGDRDRGKRPLMGQIAHEKADQVIVTDDNPRTEDAAEIRAEILAAAPGAMEVGDRAKAIEQAVSRLRKGDALIIAGKGHETGQTVGSRVVAFSDEEEVKRALIALGGSC